MERVYPPAAYLQKALEELRLSPLEFAYRANLSPKIVKGILTAKKEIDLPIAVKLANAAGGHPQTWMNLQRKWNESINYNK